MGSQQPTNQPTITKRSFHSFISKDFTKEKSID